MGAGPERDPAQEVTSVGSELRGERRALEEALAEVGAEREEAEVEELSQQLARIPDLAKALREASPEVQRQVFEAFELQILYDKAGRRIEISATVSEAVANAFDNKKALPKEGSLVVVRDIAGARFVSRYHPPRIRETTRHPDSRVLAPAFTAMGAARS